MVTHGTVGPFVQGHEDLVSYTEYLQQYFIANNIDAAAKQRAILLSLCGAEIYQLMRNLVVSHKPADKSFKQLVNLGELTTAHHLEVNPSQRSSTWPSPFPLWSAPQELLLGAILASVAPHTHTHTHTHAHTYTHTTHHHYYPYANTCILMWL